MKPLCHAERSEASLIEKKYYVYIATNPTNRVLYIGVTSDLIRRIYEHKEHSVDGFTSRYNVQKLVYYEIHDQPLQAITREKQIKGWLRAKKIVLVESMNPSWRDLYKDIC